MSGFKPHQTFSGTDDPRATAQKLNQMQTQLTRQKQVIETLLLSTGGGTPSSSSGGTVVVQSSWSRFFMTMGA